jgi:hypothetical protein
VTFRAPVLIENRNEMFRTNVRRFPTNILASPGKILNGFFISLMHATCQTHVTVLELIIATVFSKEERLEHD